MLPITDEIVRKGLLTRDGTLVRYAWPGSYTVTYVVRAEYWRDEGFAHAKCCDRHDSGIDYTVVDGDVLWEGPDEECMICGERIATEYGDPNAEEEAREESLREGG